MCAQQSHNSNDDCNTYVPCQVEVSYFDRKNTHCVLSYEYEYIVMTAQILTAAMGELYVTQHHGNIAHQSGATNSTAFRCTKLMIPYVEAYVLRLTCGSLPRGLRRTAAAVDVEAHVEVAPLFPALFGSLEPE